MEFINATRVFVVPRALNPNGIYLIDALWDTEKYPRYPYELLRVLYDRKNQSALDITHMMVGGKDNSLRYLNSGQIDVLESYLAGRRFEDDSGLTPPIISMHATELAGEKFSSLADTARRLFVQYGELVRNMEALKNGKGGNLDLLV